MSKNSEVCWLLQHGQIKSAFHLHFISGGVGYWIEGLGLEAIDIFRLGTALASNPKSYFFGESFIVDTIRVFRKGTIHLGGQLSKLGQIPVHPAIVVVLLRGPRGAGLLVPFLGAAFVPTLILQNSHVLSSPFPLLKIQPTPLIGAAGGWVG